MVVVAVRTPPPWVVIVPPPRTFWRKVKPRPASWVSRIAPVPVTVIGASSWMEVPAAAWLRMVASDQVMTPVAALLERRPNCWVRLRVPPVRLYWLMVPLTVVETRLSRTIQGVVRTPPDWFRMPTPSTPTYTPPDCSPPPAGAAPGLVLVSVRVPPLRLYVETLLPQCAMRRWSETVTAPPVWLTLPATPEASPRKRRPVRTVEPASMFRRALLTTVPTRTMPAALLALPSSRSMVPPLSVTPVPMVSTSTEALVRSVRAAPVTAAICWPGSSV